MSAKKHWSLIPEEWESRARQERLSAEAARRSPRGDILSIQIHEKNAEEYEQTAKDLREAAANGLLEGPGSPVDVVSFYKAKNGGAS